MSCQAEVTVTESARCRVTAGCLIDSYLDILDKYENASRVLVNQDGVPIVTQNGEYILV